MKPTEAKFKDYALDQEVKAAPGMRATLDRNRHKLWARAYRPIERAISQAQSIMDYGCGSGEFLVYLKERTSAKLSGYDPSETQLAVAKRACPWAELASEKRSGKKFDWVFSNHVVEHIPDAALADYFLELTSAVAPEGKLVITTPNGTHPLAHAYYMSTDTTHVRMHSPLSLAELLRPHGFVIESVFRETPQAYDLPSFFKTAVWAWSACWLKIVLMSLAPGVRGLGLPITLSGSFYIVARRVS